MILSESEIKQLEFLKTLQPSERFGMMVELIDSQFEAMRSGIRYMNPNMGEKEVNECLKKRMMLIYSMKP